MPMNANIFKLQWISHNFIDSHFLHAIVPSILDNLFNEFSAEHLKYFKIFCIRNLGRFNFYICTKTNKSGKS